MTTEPQRPPLIERLQAQRDRHSRRPRPIRALYVVAGFAILAAGIVLLVTPGPAFVVIPIGLALLSLEFAWAGQLLEAAVRRSEQAKQRASRSTRKERVLSACAALLVCTGFVVLASLADIPFLPV